MLWALLSITVGAYIGTAVIAGLLFFFFNPAGAGDCSFNISVIALTLALGVLVSAVSMSPYVSCPNPLCLPQVPALQAGCGQPYALCNHIPLVCMSWNYMSLLPMCRCGKWQPFCSTPKCQSASSSPVPYRCLVGHCAAQARNGSLFPAAGVTLYCTYLAYSALVSEPHDYACNGAHTCQAAGGFQPCLAPLCLRPPRLVSKFGKRATAVKVCQHGAQECVANIGYCQRMHARGLWPILAL